MGGAAAKSFSLNQVGSQAGKVAIVTGGNAGIGLAIVKGLASKGATVVIASRSQEKVNAAVVEVQQLYPNSKIEGMVLDVSSFTSIDKFVESFKRYQLNLHYNLNDSK